VAEVVAGRYRFLEQNEGSSDVDVDEFLPRVRDDVRLVQSTRPTRSSSTVLAELQVRMFISRFTGENFLARGLRNRFDVLFLLTVGMSLLVFAIAIPFFLVDYSSLPLSVGILTGLMWVPMSWLIRHWIGIGHAVARTGLIVAAWYAWPESRFVVIPVVIVAVYAVTIVVLETRWRGLRVA